jgi:hypothetical protein
MKFLMTTVMQCKLTVDGFMFWEYKPDASLFFVPAGEPDTFDQDDWYDHILVGRLAYGKSDKKLALLTTPSEDALDELMKLGEIYDVEDLAWTPVNKEQ